MVPGVREEGLKLPVENPSVRLCWDLQDRWGILISVSIWFLSVSESVSTSPRPLISVFPISLPVSFLSTPLPPPLPPSLPPERLSPHSLTPAPCSPEPFLLHFLSSHSPSTTSHPFFILPPNGQMLPLESSIFSASPPTPHLGNVNFP